MVKVMDVFVENLLVADNREYDSMAKVKKDLLAHGTVKAKVLNR